MESKNKITVLKMVDKTQYVVEKISTKVFSVEIDGKLYSFNDGMVFRYSERKNPYNQSCNTNIKVKMVEGRHDKIIEKVTRAVSEFKSKMGMK